MKTIPALIALVLSAGPAIACPEHSAAAYQLSSPLVRQLQPCRSLDLGYLQPTPTCTKPVAVNVAAVLPPVSQQPVVLPPLPQPSAASTLETIDRMLAAPRFSTGSVYVRPHTRCNSRKCWSVRSYYRSR
jgi:hypothetical protein